MPITSIEYVTMAPKTQETVQQKHSEIIKPQTDQQQAAATVNSQVMKNLTQTVKTNKSDNPEYRYDAKEKGKNSYNGQKQSNSKKNDQEFENNKKNSEAPVRGFDVRI